MIGAHGKGRWPEVVGGHGGPPMGGKTAGNTASRTTRTNRVGVLCAFVGPLVRLLVATHGSGGVGGCWGNQVVVMGGQKMAAKWLEKSTENSQQQWVLQCRLIVEGGLSTFLSPLLARLRQNISWVL